MTRIHSTEELLLPTFMNNGRKTAGIRKEKLSVLTWHSYHGSAMLVAFSILIPSSVAYIRSGMPYAFTVHWIMQLTAALLAISSAAYATAMSWGTLEVTLDYLICT